MPATKNTPSTHHPRRRNVTTLTVGLKKTKTVTYAKISPKSGEPQRYSWGTQKKKKKKKVRSRSLQMPIEYWRSNMHPITASKTGLKCVGKTRECHHICRLRKSALIGTAHTLVTSHEKKKKKEKSSQST